MPFSLDHYRTARQAAVLVDRSSRGRLVVRGRDRRTFLHALLTNDIASLQPGDGCYAALLSPQGRMVTDLRLFDIGDLILLDVPGPTTAGLLGKLDQMVFAEDVALGDVSGAFGCLSLQGPLASGILATLFADREPAFADWPSCRNARLDLAGSLVIVARWDEYGAPGFLVFAEPDLLPALTRTFEAAGATSADDDTIEVLRIESGVPLFLRDMTDATLPPEAGIEPNAVSYTKGCFPGQEVLVRIRDRGHGRVARRLVGLSFAGPGIPGRGSEVQAGGKPVGEVTSAAFSPALGHPVALAYVTRDLSVAGTPVSVVIDGVPSDATVTELPFVG